jgi:hypothetical protein
MGRTKNYLSWMILFLVVLLTSCNPPSRNLTRLSTPTVEITPISTLTVESTAIPSPPSAEIPILLTPTSSIPVSSTLTTVTLENGLAWTECVLPYRDYFYTKTDVAMITDCLKLNWPPSQIIDNTSYGQRLRGEALDDFRLVIGNDTYEAKGMRRPPIYDYELLKNGVVIAKASATFTTFDPNQTLRNIGGKAVWELISDPPVIFVDGVDFNEKYHLDGSFFPHSIQDKLIFIAKKDGKFRVVYDGEMFGPEFDEISMAYCCAKFSVIEGNDQYWFLGKRDGVQHAIAINLAELAPTATIGPTQITVGTISPTLPSATSVPIARAPVIHDLPGDVYETVFSISAGRRGILKYTIPTCCTDIEGPNAIAVLSDETFLISDLIGRRLLNYDREGHLLKTIKVDPLGIGYVRDLRVKGNEIFLLEMTYQKFRLHRLTLDGELIASEEIPYQFPIDPTDKDFTLDNALSGIAIDCEGRIILEVTGGSKLFPLSDVQNQPDPTLITQGLLCNDRRFFVSIAGPWRNPQVTAGEMNYQTPLTAGLGGLNFLDVFQDGSFYLERVDVMPITDVDQTIHYIDKNGVVQGVARVPLSEYYYHSAYRRTAVGPDGEVYALLPRPDSLDVIRLNFYRELEPLMPEAVIPQITISQSKP